MVGRFARHSAVAIRNGLVRHRSRRRGRPRTLRSFLEGELKPRLKENGCVTLVAQSGGFRCAEARLAEVPTGTSGAVSWASGRDRHGMAVYRIDDLPRIP